MTFENLHNLQKRIEELRRQAEIAEREGNLERVAQILYGELPMAEKECRAYEKKYAGVEAKKKGKETNGRYIKETVDDAGVKAAAFLLLIQFPEILMAGVLVQMYDPVLVMVRFPLTFNVPPE